MADILDDPFESPKLLVQGAKEDAIEFEAKWAAYCDAARCAPVAYDDRKTGHKFIKVRVENGPPTRLRYIASNILNNIRHALDQAANEAAVALGHNKRDGYFPFSADEAQFEQVVKGRCKGFDPALTSFFWALKPYGGGDDLLYGLSKVATRNKHQITLNIGPDLDSFVLNHMVAEFRGPGTLGNLGWDKKKLELHLATLVSAESRIITCINDDTRLTLRIEIGGSPSFAGKDATTLLNTLTSKVERIVLAIEAETARILRERAV